jgi:hypothetical protein
VHFRSQQNAEDNQSRALGVTARRICASLLIVAIMTTILWGRSSPEAEPFTAEDMTATSSESVTRAETPLPELPVVLRDQGQTPVSHMLRMPVRITDRDAANHDLNAIVARALGALGTQPESQSRLHGLLVETLAEGQSDAYIHAAVNAAFARGEFEAPDGLETAEGRLDTPRLLQAVLAQVSG